MDLSRQPRRLVYLFFLSSFCQQVSPFSDRDDEDRVRRILPAPTPTRTRHSFTVRETAQPTHSGRPGAFTGRFRGHSRRDGRITLLTVDYRLTDDAVRLAESFRRYVSGDWPMIAVQNYDRSRNPALGIAELQGRRVRLERRSRPRHRVGAAKGSHRVRPGLRPRLDPASRLRGRGSNPTSHSRNLRGIVSAGDEQRCRRVSLAFRMSLWHTGQSGR